MPDEAKPLLLDTHVWVWAAEADDTRLSSHTLDRIETASTNGTVLISAISVWEVALLVAKARLSLTRPVDEWVAAGLRHPGVRLQPLSPEIAIESTRLPGEPHGDPADRTLIAGARAAGAALVTCDRAILEYARSGAVAVVDARPRAS